MTRTSLTSLVLALTALLAVPTGPAFASNPDAILATAAKSWRTPVLGGPGGSHFELECEFRGMLVGVRVRFGLWLDQIDAVCATFRAGALVYGPEDRLPGIANEPPSNGRYGTAGAAIGGDGGQADAEIMCPHGSLVTGLGLSVSEGGPAPFAANIALKCTDFRTMTTVTVSQNPPVFGRDRAGQLPVACASDESWYYAAKGIYGRSGNYIDGVGLICDPFRDGLYERPADRRYAEGKNKAEKAASQAEISSETRVTKKSPFGKTAIQKGPGYSEVRPGGRQDRPDEVVRHASPQIYVQGKGSVALDWCREWGINCGAPAADAFCRELSPDQPYQAGFEKAPGIGRTAIITSREICEPSCDGFVHITCTATRVQTSSPR